jgi:hypothetical protein
MHASVIKGAGADQELVDVILLITDVEGGVFDKRREGAHVFYEMIVAAPHLSATLDGNAQNVRRRKRFVVLPYGAVHVVETVRLTSENDVRVELPPGRFDQLTRGSGSLWPHPEHHASASHWLCLDDLSLIAQPRNLCGR